MNIHDKFDKCVTATKDGMLNVVECKLGLWGVECVNEAAALREAMHYFKQYLEDGEYSELLNESKG